LVDVWCVRLDAPELPHDELAAMLDSDEQGRAARMRFDGRVWSAARGSQRVILASYLDVPATALVFSTSESGKPRLVGVHGLEFSFARTDGLAVVAVASDREVGVDVERENDRTDIDLVAREFLPLGEVAALERTEPDRRRSAFFEAWARHEAHLKLRGQGLTNGVPENLRDPHIVVRTLALRPGFAAAVAAEGSWTVRVRDFPPTGRLLEPQDFGAIAIASC
jgi:4'-phosphopantetheinyl transferase